jgi:hypothetical protein
MKWQGGSGQAGKGHDGMISQRARQRSEWVWMLTCRRCSRVAGFDAVSVPTARLAEWATCCGEIMELNSVERRAADA